MKAKPSFLALAVIAAGCSPDISPTNPEDAVKVVSNKIAKPSDLWPLQSGNAWTYSLTATERNQQGQSGRVAGNPTLKVTGVVSNKVTIAFIQAGKQASELKFSTTPNGAVQNAIRGAKGPERTFTPAVPLFQWPMKVDEERTWSGNGYRAAFGDVGKMTSTLVYKGESEVDTPAGRMKAHRFDTLMKYSKGAGEFGSTQSLWLVPKIGLVRSVEIVIMPKLLRETEMKLESYTVK